MLEKLLHKHKKAELAQIAERIETISLKKTVSKAYLIEVLVDLETEEFTNVLSSSELEYYLSQFRIKPKKNKAQNLAELTHILIEGETLAGESVSIFDPGALKNEVKSLKALFRSKDTALIKQGIEIFDVLTPSYAAFYRYLEAFGYPIEGVDLFDRKVLTEILFGKSIVRHYDQHSNIQFVGWWCLGKMLSFPEFHKRVGEVQTFEVYGAEWSEFPETIVNFTEITEVYFTRGQASEFPEELFSFEKLEVLNLSSNKIKTIPPEIKNFKKLRIINCNHNWLKELPSEIGDIDTLQELNCGSNQLEKLPETIGKLSQLARLDLAVNHLGYIPSTITNIKTLLNLDISSNPVRELPEGLDKMGLKEFRFDKSKIEILPDEFEIDGLYQKFNLTEFHNLIRLPKGVTNIWADVGAWKRYQEKVCELPNVKSLKIENLSFFRAFTRYGSIQNMQYFGQTQTPEQLTELTSNIGRLDQLQDLEISNNQFKFLPETIGDLCSLVAFRAENCKLILLPKTLGKLKQLKVLGLKNNRLRELPAEIGHLDSLEELQLQGNALLALPESMGELKKLEVLELEDNALRKMPDSLLRLSKLKRLGLRDNPISEQERARIRSFLPDTEIEF